MFVANASRLLELWGTPMSFRTAFLLWAEEITEVVDTLATFDVDALDDARRFYLSCRGARHEYNGTAFDALLRVAIVPFAQGGLTLRQTARYLGVELHEVVRYVMQTAPKGMDRVVYAEHVADCEEAALVSDLSIRRLAMTFGVGRDCVRKLKAMHDAIGVVGRTRIMAA